MTEITLPPATEVVVFTEGKMWEKCCRAAMLLAKLDIEPLWITSPLQLSQGAATLDLDAGDIVVPVGTKSPEDVCRTVAQQLGIEVAIAVTSHAARALRIGPARIAVYGGGGAPFNHAACLGELGFDVGFIEPEEIHRGGLAQFDVLIVPGGGALAMAGQIAPLGHEGTLLIRKFVEAGGMYIGSCAGSFGAALTGDAFLNAVPEQANLRMINAEVWNASNDTDGLRSPGVGVIQTRIAQTGHPVTLGLPENLDTTHYNGPFFSLQNGRVPGASDALGLTCVAGARADFTPGERFLASEGLSDGSMIDEAAKLGVFNTVAGQFFNGRVVLFGSHPEFGFGPWREAFGPPSRMLANAVLWQSGTLGSRPVAALPGPLTDRYAKSYHAAVLPRIVAIALGARQLLARGEPTGNWLDRSNAMSIFGLSPQLAWHQGLEAFSPVAVMLHALLGETERLKDSARKALLAAQGQDQAMLWSALNALDEAVFHAPPVAKARDFGYEGLLKLLDRSLDMLLGAGDGFDLNFEPDADPYRHAASSPYHLAVGSYLSAIGIFENAWLLLMLHRSQLENALIVAQTRQVGN